jgi:hypothetical protein
MRRVVDFAERRAYIELVVEYGGYHRKEKPVESSQSTGRRGVHMVVEHIGSQKRISSAPRGVY